LDLPLGPLSELDNGIFKCIDEDEDNEGDGDLTH
jgi:hypothetical protein